jgi:hypothetical protein
LATIPLLEPLPDADFLLVEAADEDFFAVPPLAADDLEADALLAAEVFAVPVDFLAAEVLLELPAEADLAFEPAADALLAPLDFPEAFAAVDFAGVFAAVDLAAEVFFIEADFAAEDLAVEVLAAGAFAVDFAAEDLAVVLFAAVEDDLLDAALPVLAVVDFDVADVFFAGICFSFLGNFGIKVFRNKHRRNSI